MANHKVSSNFRNILVFKIKVRFIFEGKWRLLVTQMAVMC
jgi:hypothetical protein